MKKVSVIVPVYNAEKYLGYCLNSLLSQTHTNWTAYLVNDGSCDSSLEICRRYAEIDSRFRVISIANSGVSNARNVGLDQADGDYLEFLDSDDVLAPEALSNQVKLAEAYKSQLVVSDMLMVDFEDIDATKVRLTGEWFQGDPAVLDSSEFENKLMRGIWYTALLEGPCAKLYDRSLWESLNLRFPVELSLGEDFVTNLKYYKACNRVVFTKDIAYYYGNTTSSNSLTHKYRENLFENKMYLNNVLAEHIGVDEGILNEEADAYYCYVASSGLKSIENFLLSDNELTKRERIAKLKSWFSNPRFIEAVRKASFIPENLRGLVDIFDAGDFKGMLKGDYRIVPDIDQDTPAAKPSLANRVVRKIMRTSRPVFGDGAVGERIERWEREFASQGISRTVKTHMLLKSIATNQQLFDVEVNLKKQISETESKFKQQLFDVEVNLKKQISETESKFKQQFYDVEVAVDNVNSKLSSTVDNINSKLSSTVDSINSKLSSAVNDVNGYVWLTEQRLHRYEYLRDINELRQRKKAIMIATAEHANIGDAAITLAEQNILSKQFPEYYQVEISTYEFAQKEVYLHSILNPDDIIFINGGGNIGDAYAAEEQLHRKIISEFPNNKIIVFPQTISFSDTDTGMAELAKSSAVYNGHKDLTMFLRGRQSMEFAQRHFYNVKTFLMPDVVSLLRAEYAFERKGALLCLREDEEGCIENGGKGRIVEVVERRYGDLERSTNIADSDVTRDIRAYVVNQELMRFAKHKVVVTDRLHGMIFAAVTGTPCVVMSSYNHKIKEYYEAFFESSNAVLFIGDELDRLEDAIDEVINIADPRYPSLDKNELVNLRAISKA